MVNTNRLLKIFFLITALAIIVLSSGKIFNHGIKSDSQISLCNNEDISEKTKIFPELADDYKYFLCDTINDAYVLFNSADEKLATVLFSFPYCDSIIGYGDNIPLAIVFDKSDKIEQIYFFPNHETKSWMKSLKKDGFFDKWNGLTAKKALNLEVDAISGATYTSKAVISTVRHRLSLYTDSGFFKFSINWYNLLGLILSFVVLIFAVFSFLMPEYARKFRIYLLLASVGILGFWQGKFLSLALLHNWLLNGFDIWDQIFLFTVLILAVVLPLVTNKAFYCQYVCPYGAAQELIWKLNPKKKSILGYKITKYLKYLKYLYLLIILSLIVVAVDVKLEDLEPFSAFKFQFASLIVIVLAVLMLILSLFFNKAWCKYFCPTGAILTLFRAKRGKSKKKNISWTLLINLVFILSVLVVFYANYKNKSQNFKVEEEEVKMNTCLDLIHSRKSVRSFTDEVPSKEQLEILVKAGMAAPSARNLQPWAFVIITDREKLDTLASALPYAKMLYDVKAAIVVCGDLTKAYTEVDSAYWVQDCSLASGNILLAAHAIGLGSVWTAAYPYPDRMKPIIEVLKLPEHIIPLNVLPIGYPKGEEKPKDKWKPENVHWEVF
ncbi:MAG: 4Fe-4S binding protein [Bacteroidales bacterium]|jgi:nitroreductase|nr:nitroreductase family protein [Bacteroidales bacterium]MCK9498731.1 nitroreductase family protein [Bacteroidales bacterium]MDY0313796.1 nitroreductase family protein [Bacteroidales bacterium]NLB85849.1 4Fe-4S binding protein [Bacteroidales bacterium]